MSNFVANCSGVPVAPRLINSSIRMITFIFILTASKLPPYTEIGIQLEIFLLFMERLGEGDALF